MSFEIINNGTEEKKSIAGKLSKRSKKLHRCLEICVNLKDRKILVAAHGVFLVSLGVVLSVGHYSMRATTTSSVHTQPSIPTVLTSSVVILSGLLFSSLVFKKQQYLTIAAIILSTASGILSAIGAVHYGITVSDRLTALSDCMYDSVQRLCTCSVVTSSSRLMYNFENTVNCNIITKHLREVSYGMCGVYAVTFVSCFGASVYAILLAHRVAIKKMNCMTQKKRTTLEKSTTKLSIEEHSDEFISGDNKKCNLPWQQDVATQTASRDTRNDVSCRHQCRHFVEVTVPDTNNDFVVNITKTRDPPPPYCEKLTV